MKITRTQRTQDMDSKPGQNPTIGVNPKNPLLGELDQSETSKTERPKSRFLPSTNHPSNKISSKQVKV